MVVEAGCVWWAAGGGAGWRRPGRSSPPYRRCDTRGKSKPEPPHTQTVRHREVISALSESPPVVVWMDGWWMRQGQHVPPHPPAPAGQPGALHTHTGRYHRSPLPPLCANPPSFLTHCACLPACPPWLAPLPPLPGDAVPAAHARGGAAAGGGAAGAAEGVRAPHGPSLGLLLLLLPHTPAAARYTGSGADDGGDRWVGGRR